MKYLNRIKTLSSDERGAALVLAILSLLLVTILVFALYATGTVSRDITINSRQQSEAFFASEAGLTHGMKLIAAAPINEFSSILTAGANPTPGSGDELSTRPSELTPIPQAGIVIGNGRYQVFVSDDPAETDNNPNVDTNSRLLIRSVGTGADGSTVETEAILRVDSAPGILINGPLMINGNPVVSGIGGAVHANGQLTVSGNPCVAQYASSGQIVVVFGTLYGPPNCTGTGVTNSFQPPIVVPQWDIPTLAAGNWDYRLNSNGTITAAVNPQPVMSGNDWNIPSCGSGKWTWNSGSRTWVHGGGCLPANKTWYVDGNMELASDFGTDASPVKATFLANGFITVSAKPVVTANLQNKYAFMAQTDLTLNGNPSSGYNSSQGIHYANNQIKFNGNPRISGIVIAGNYPSPGFLPAGNDPDSPGCGCNPVPLINPVPGPGRMEISGNPEVNYDGGLIAGQARIMSWREVRR